MIVASNARMKDDIFNRLKNAGVCIKKNEVAKDLGLDAAAGSRRTTAEQRKRIRKAKKEASKSDGSGARQRRPASCTTPASGQ